MPEVIKKVLMSRKDLLVLLLLVALSVFFALGRIDMDKWWEMVKWVAGPWLVARGIEDAATHQGSTAALLGIAHDSDRASTPPAEPEEAPE